MLTSITIQNFKGIGDPVTIPIRPLTIMFGKNSAGKSTLIHALLYAREVLINNNPNADRTALGGKSVDLGGLRSLVHKNQYLDRVVRMKFEFDISRREFPEYDDWDADLVDLENNLPELPRDIVERLSMIKMQRGKNLYEEIAKLQESVGDDKDSPGLTASVEFAVQWSEVLSQPVITEYKTWIRGESAGRIITSLDRRDIRWEVNIDNTVLGSTDEPGMEVWMPIFDAKAGPGLSTSLPKWGRPLYVMPFGSLYESFDIGYETITQLITGPGDLLVGYLREPGLSDLRYIGPMREIPNRNYSPNLTGSESDWSNGTAAWDRLLADDDLAVLSSWWMGPDNLKTGYSVEIERYRELPLDCELMIALVNRDVLDRISDTSSEIKKFPIRARLRVVDTKTGIRLEPFDIGVGISQVIPVVVAAIDSSGQFVAIEQPELHLHPAVQAELGDLFISSAVESRNFFLLETHSEHLILRVLRRIRETEAGQSAEGLRLSPTDVSLLFVGTGAENSTEFLCLRVDKRGRIVDRVPGGFFEEDFAEIF